MQNKNFQVKKFLNNLNVRIFVRGQASKSLLEIDQLSMELKTEQAESSQVRLYYIVKNTGNIRNHNPWVVGSNPTALTSPEKIAGASNSCLAFTFKKIKE